MTVVVEERGSFGGRLRKLREAAGLSQEELAERAGLSSHAVSALERGTRTRPYPHTIRALADALGADDDERAALIAAVPSRRRSARKPADAAETGRGRDLPVPTTTLLGRDAELGTGRGAGRARTSRDPHRDRRRGQDPARPRGRGHCRTGFRGRGGLRRARATARPGPGAASRRGRRGRRTDLGPRSHRRPGRAAARQPDAPGPRQRRTPPRRGAADRGPGRGRAGAHGAGHQPGAAEGARRGGGGGRAACAAHVGCAGRAGDPPPPGPGGLGEPGLGERPGGAWTQLPRSASGSQAFPWRSSWPRPGRGCSTPAPSSRDSTPLWSRVRGTCPSGNARCGRRWTGVTTCCSPRSRRCCGCCLSSSVASGWTIWSGWPPGPGCRARCSRCWRRCRSSPWS